MHLVVGQFEKLDDAKIQALIDHVQRGKTSICSGVRIRRERMRPLCWSVFIEFDITTLPFLSAEKTLEFVRQVTSFLGPGTYYFRGSEGLLEEFWDSRSCTLHIYTKLFRGLPLSITIGSDLPVIDFSMEWMREFVDRNYRLPFAPAEDMFELDNRLRLLCESISFLLAVKGNWLYRVNSGPTDIAKESSCHKTILVDRFVN